METTETRKEKKEQVRFLVETKGYKESFESLNKAQNQLEILKKRAIKNQQPIKVKLSERKGGKLVLLDELNINESYFND